MEKGAKGFSREYWQENYSEPLTMDGIGNAKYHVKYMKAFLELHHIEAKKIVDLGFGLGGLLKEINKQFSPDLLVGVEPSAYAFKKVATKQWLNRNSNTRLYQKDILGWLQNNKKGEKTFDLGVCNSVFQYLSDDEINETLSMLFKRVKVLYLSTPTDVELQNQVDELEFHDRFAIYRTQAKYIELISPYFNFVGSRFLESRYFYDLDDTPFNDLLYRFEFPL